MKFINFTKEDLRNVIIIILIVLFSLFTFTIKVDAQFQYPTISYATCDEAFLEWNVDDYTYSLIDRVRIVYEGVSGVADLSTNLYYSIGTTHWWRADVPSWWVNGYKLNVRGYVELTSGQTYNTINFRRVDCKYKVYLPTIVK